MANKNDLDKKDSEWLVMVYLAGDNNLSPFSIGILQALEAAEYGDNVRVVAAFDSPTPWPKGARYLEIKHHKKPSHPFHHMKWPLHNDLQKPGHIVVSPDFCEKVKRKPPSEPIAEEAIARFFDWVTENYTAKKYMLILFGHGPLVAGHTFLVDTNPPSYLKLGTFAKILKDHFPPKINILACYNCVMNGIETAVQIQDRVDYMLGSQSLMLANGWPIQKIVEVVGNNSGKDPKEIAEKVLRVSARNLLDFALMEQSSEQAVCDLTKFGKHDQIVTAVRALSAKLQDGLQFKPGTEDQELLYPVVRDLVRLARLEAQSYWHETFVDLYDFAALLVEKCDEFVRTINGMTESLIPGVATQLERRNKTVKDLVSRWPLIRTLEGIAFWCRRITDIFHYEKIVPCSYYVCPKLQYSHGISIYFPWTLPEGPMTFEPNYADGPRPTNYYLKTPFEEYETYLFAKPEYGDWERFLKAFFRATLRNVRVVDHEFVDDPSKFYRKESREKEGFLVFADIDLQKSGSGTGDSDDVGSVVKNYPRRFYVSPADCKRRMKVYGLPDQPEQTEEEAFDTGIKVSYLGWNIRGLLAEEVGLSPSTATFIKKTE